MSVPASGLFAAGVQSGRLGQPDGAVREQRFTTNALSPRERFSYWKEAVCESVAGVEIKRAGAENFSGEIHCRAFGLGSGERAFFIDIASVPQAARHGPRHVAKETDAWINLVIARRGDSRSSQGGHSLALRPGDMVLKDLSRPSDIRFDKPYRQLVFKVPRRRFETRLPREPLWMSRSVNSRSPLGRVLIADIASLSRAVGVVDPELHPRLVDRTVDLIALTFAGEPRHFNGCGSTVQRALLLRAMHFIDDHLADPDLRGATVAAALGISQGYLQHLFQGTQTTLRDYTRRRRLERCRDDLADPIHRGEHVSEIALRWGFRDMPWFSRAFRREFGHAPRDWRALASEGAFDRGV